MKAKKKARYSIYDAFAEAVAGALRGELSAEHPIDVEVMSKMASLLFRRAMKKNAKISDPKLLDILIGLNKTFNARGTAKQVGTSNVCVQTIAQQIAFPLPHARLKKEKRLEV